MKRVLITGKDSYIGNKVAECLIKNGYIVNTLDMVNSDWKKYDFHNYDVIYHVAGIAHRKNVPDALYYQVNHELAVEVAQKASDEGVGQFVFMSSGAVYTQNDRRHKIIIVDENSDLKPSTPYGKSKLMAEMDLKKIETTMKIAIIRPPMVYGPGAKGNYNSLSKFAKTVPIIPQIENKRSMIYIDNLTEFVKLIIQNNSEGTFLPQNKEYINTCQLIKKIADIHGKKVRLIKGFKWLVNLAGGINDKVNKVFGTFIYIPPQDEYFDGKYQLVGFEDSIVMTETK